MGRRDGNRRSRLTNGYCPWSKRQNDVRNIPIFVPDPSTSETNDPVSSGKRVRQIRYLVGTLTLDETNNLSKETGCARDEGTFRVECVRVVPRRTDRGSGTPHTPPPTTRVRSGETGRAD